MTMRMLIDARHPEETRVAVVKGNRIEEFDFESEEHRQLKGNIYLAKVTRVEPSLQAAFVDYGGNRHGFLAFSEIHPDYYQIPKEDREALLREEAEHAAEEERLRAEQEGDEDADYGLDEEGDEGALTAGDDRDEIETVGDGAAHDEDGAPYDDADAPEGDEEAPTASRRRRGNGGDENAVEALRQRRMSLRRRYKIQDVIRRRQVLLVQVVKEERGNKGAALTTYLSLAGRYCVLMPNTSHGGGISRKISNGADRKRLKQIMAELELPRSMGCIVRTAGLQRTKTEIKRDFDYLARLWDGIREMTLQSSAPALIHEDSGLIKRAIRDIYNRDIDEVIVEGEHGWRAARSFMKLLMPSHAKKVGHYADTVPLFQRFGVEDQLSAMYQPLVQLKSGGYLVINPTEALVSIDINSGRSTREHNIEQTALSTNLEAAKEIARQLRLRDMAGLVVIDFIDMENGSNVRKIERAMKEALKDDRARIQVGRISSFGLMEMSRQRLRTGVLEASTRTCPHCEGTGLVRTASSAGLSALRMLEDEAARGRGSRLLLRCSQEAAFYVLNRKRAELAEIEDRYGVMIEVVSDGSMEGARMAVEAGGPPPSAPPRPMPALAAPVEDEDDLIEDEIEEEDDEAEEAEEPQRAERSDRGEEGGEGGRRRRRRRRRRGGRRDEEGSGGAQDASDEAGEAGEADEADERVAADTESGDEHAVTDPAAGETGEGGRRRRGRRGRRGGRNRGEGLGAEAAAEGEALPVEEADADPASAAGEEAVEAVALDAQETPPAPEADIVAEPASTAEAEPAPAPDAAPKTRRRPRARKAEPAEGEVTADAAGAPAVEAVAGDAAETAPKPARRRRKAEPEAPVEAGEVAEAPKPRRGRRKAEAAPEPQPETQPQPAAEPQAAVVTDAPGETAPVDTSAAAGTLDPEIAAEAEAVDTALDASASGNEGAGVASDPAPRRGWWQRTFGG